MLRGGTTSIVVCLQVVGKVDAVRFAAEMTQPPKQDRYVRSGPHVTWLGDPAIVAAGDEGFSFPFGAGRRQAMH